MNKRYQIFISSTFNDLEKERMLLAQNILRKGYYPAGMEWFHGIDEEQFEYIKQVIDDSDYYVLILGGLYGTIGRYILTYFLQCFKERQAYPSLKSCVDNSI